MNIVECRSDSMFAERPLSITWQGRKYEVAEIFARWRGPEERGFRVKTADGHAFEITYREIPDEWHVQPI